MHSILSRRKVLSSAAAAAGAFAAGAPARAETHPSPDPDADAVLARMTNLSERGLSLPLKSRHLVMLATLSAIGLPEHVESAVKAALEGGLAPAEVKEAIYQTTLRARFLGSQVRKQSASRKGRQTAAPERRHRHQRNALFGRLQGSERHLRRRHPPHARDRARKPEGAPCERPHRLVLRRLLHA